MNLTATQKTDEELLAESRSGNSDAFKKIIKKYESRVAAAVIGMLGHCTESEDIGQETFIRFYKSLDRFRGDSSVGTYLTRIAINLSINELRRRKSRRKLFFTKPDNPVEDIPDTSNPARRNEARKIVQRGIQKLGLKFRSVIVLRLINGYSTRETARILNLPKGTVLSRLARGQKKLKEILTPLYRDGNEYMGKDNE